MDFDPDQIPLSTSEGRRPSSTAGDRMMVGLAALALMGGVLIAVSRLIPEQPDQTSQASATPVQSAEDRASPSPRPSPSPRSPRTVTVDPAPLPSVAPPSAYTSEWVRLRTGVTLLDSPSSTAHPSGRLHRGDAAYVSGTPPEEGGVEGWLQVEGPVSGWIFDDINNRAMFERFPPHWQSSSVVHGLASDTNGFTAFGWTANGSEEVMLASSDGTHWRTSEPPSAAWGRAIANGPAGWLMAGTVDSQGATRTTVWQSADGESWDRLGALPPTMTDGITALAGSPAGYVLLTDASRSGAAGIWFSADGLLWTERPLAEMRTDMGMRLAATPLGFFIWGLNNPISEGDGAFSTDGWTWAEADPIGPGQIVDVAADGDHLLAVGPGPGGTRMWKGTIEGEQLTWSSDNTAPFRGATVGRLLSDGERAIVLGWDRATEMALWWERDGLSWQRHTMPGTFGALPLDAVAGAKGIVAVGQAASAGGRTPVFWHLGDGVTWEREPSPVMPAPAAPTPQTCGPKPDDLLALISADNVWTAVCYGDVPIRVRGWSVACDGCYYSSSGTWKPKWLSQPTDERILHLAPVESSDWGYLDGILHPSVRGPMPPPSRWLEVTGHFDDPEAASCRWTPTLVDEYWYPGSYDIIAGCRARFVVTAIRPVKGP